MTKQKKRLILLGGGGHCTSCIEAIESSGDWDIVGIIDLPAKIRAEVLGYPIIGSDEDVPSFVKNKRSFFMVTLGQIKTASERSRLYSLVKDNGGRLPIVKASTAYVSGNALLGDGCIVLHKAFVNAGARLGKNGIINTGAILEHNVIIGDHCHISTMAVLNGGARIGNECFIGSGTIISQSISICDKCIIGAGTVVLKDITRPGFYAGIPARRINNDY